MTGGRGDRLIIDDPHSTETAESEAERARTTRIFRESVPLRLNDPVKSAIVIIMQRLHANDVSGVALALKLGYVHIMLPMAFEPERRCITPIGQDPRVDDGELLFPDRFPLDTVERDKVPLGVYGIAGQFQQRPAPREGGLFKRAWFAEPVAAAPGGTHWVRHWDLAASKRRGHGTHQAATAGVKVGRAPDGTFYVGHVVRAYDEGSEVRTLIRSTAASDGTRVEISLPQDPGQAGKVQAQDMVAMLAGYVVRAAPETGDKVTRAEPVAAQAAAGNLKLVKGEWNEVFLDELANFPAGHQKDQVDALSGAFARLVQEGQLIFRTPISDLLCQPFRIPPGWPQVYALDVDWRRATALWGAWDFETDTLYLHHEYSAVRGELAIHAADIRSLGTATQGLFHLLAHGRVRDDGVALLNELQEQHLDLFALEPGDEKAFIELATMASTGRLRVFDTLEGFASEYCAYRRDEKGKPNDEDCPLIQCTKLLATSAPILEPIEDDESGGIRPSDRSPVTGY